MSQLVLLGLESVPVHRQPACTSTRSRPTPHRRQQLTPCCSYEQDVYQRQRSPGAAPPLRSPPPPPPPPPLSKSDNGPRRNLLAGLFAIIGVAAGYKLSHDNSGAYKYTPQSGRPGRRWLYADANGTYDAETARQQERRPILRASGDVVDILRPSNDKFMRMHISQRDPHQMIMEGEMGEFYTLKPASDKVDVRRMDTLLKYFADPRWELGMRRSPIAVQQE